SSLNFEDRIGAGLKFANGQSVGIRAIHYSNAGLKQPNDGIESYSLFYKIPI
ncbi:TPA: lipid A 3-O-deacylase, partial [Pseudomonas aeruginosa]